MSRFVHDRDTLIHCFVFPQRHGPGVGATERKPKSVATSVPFTDSSAGRAGLRVRKASEYQGLRQRRLVGCNANSSRGADPEAVSFLLAASRFWMDECATRVGQCVSPA